MLRLVTVGHAEQDLPGSPRLVLVPDAIGCRTFSHPVGKRSQTLLNRKRVAHDEECISMEFSASGDFYGPLSYENKTSI